MESKPLCLVVDDEPDIRELLTITLQRMKVGVQTAADLASAKALLAKQRFGLCLTDMRLPDGDGIELVRHIGQHHPQIPVAIITAYGSMATAVEALKAGAFDFVSKPVNLDTLRQMVNSALRLEKDLEEEFPEPERIMPGQSAAIRDSRRMIAKLARSQAPVYISGESGTGKELAARLIHKLGSRSDKAFVPVNCGAIPHELMESELFGHKKGSFTGALSDHDGLFQEAEGGSLFLDEVGDLPLPMQVKLLRAIQERSIRPIGSAKEVAVDTRILSASHKNLEELVRNGLFRQDLYYRINVIELRLPPLRERPDDIPILAAHILGRIGARSGYTAKNLSPSALHALQQYAFPGNVRELENIIERALALCEGKTVEVEDLQLAPGTSGETKPPIVPDDTPLEDYLAGVERSAILRALEQTRWNRTAAAKKLGITFRALRYKLAKLGLDNETEDSD